MPLTLKQVNRLKPGEVINYGNFKRATFHQIKFGSVIIQTIDGQQKQVGKLPFMQYAELCTDTNK